MLHSKTIARAYFAQTTQGERKFRGVWLPGWQKPYFGRYALRLWETYLECAGLDAWRDSWMD